MAGFSFSRKNENIWRLAAGVLKTLAALFCAFLLAAAVSAFVSAHYFKVTVRQIPIRGLESPVRAVLLTDLHGIEYGEGNARLLARIAEQEPDVIFMIGDMVPDSSDAEADTAWVAGITRKLCKIAPVYFSLGNHEQAFIRDNGDEILTAVADAGAVVLDEAFGDFEIAGNTLRIGGTMGHGYLYGRSAEAFRASPEYQVLDALETSPYPAILLAHLPDTVALSDGKARWHIDLVLSGHTHGGVIRVPGLGGLFAPMQGWWPRYDYGVFALNSEMTMVISSGFAGYGRVPRIFNMPEMCVLDLIPS